MADALDALLFDLDGTLVDTARANATAYAHALAEAGVHLEADHLAPRIAARSWRQFLPELLADARSGADAATIAARKQALYPAHFALVRVNAPLLALARSVRPALRTALVTTASAASVRALAAHLGIEGLFDTVVTGDDVARHKPHPEAYLLAAGRLVVAPERCLAFEDSDIGVESAMRAGVGVVRVAW